MKTLADMIERNARFYPDSEALICNDRRVTHGQLLQRTLKLASAFYRLGARHQDRIAILSTNNLEFYEIYRACEWAGFTAVPVNFRLAAAEILYILQDSTPSILVFEAQYADVVAAIRSQLSFVRNFVSIGHCDVADVTEFEQTLDSGDAAGPPIRAHMSDYPHILYSSGTTGRPKGIVRTHESWCAVNTTSALVTEFNGVTRLLTSSPAFHFGGIGYVNAVAWIGGTAIIHQGFNPVATLQAIAAERITFTFMVPTMLQAVLEVANVGNYDISSIKSICLAAAPIPPPLLKRGIKMFGPIFSIQFGMTESQGCYLPNHLINPNGSKEDIHRIGSVGHPCPSIELRIVDDHGSDQPIGEPGEIWLRSDKQLTAYWNNPAATREAITEDGWYKSGDIAYQDQEGYVFIIDRKKDMIISGGENIYSREVELAIGEHSAVEDCAVVGKPDVKWGESVHAFVVLAAGETIGEQDVIDHCHDLIASYKCPKGVTFAASLPRNVSGKINKVALRKQLTGDQ